MVTPSEKPTIMNLLAIEQQATAGPWEWRHGYQCYSHCYLDEDEFGQVEELECDGKHWYLGPAADKTRAIDYRAVLLTTLPESTIDGRPVPEVPDLALIVAARNALPALLRVAAAAEEAVRVGSITADLRSAIQEMRP